MDRLHENRIYTGTVESYSSEGLGIVRLDGAVVFVPQAVRGETIDLKITKVMKTAAAGEIVKIHKPSPDRAQPECPDYGRCGGCDFQHLTYPEELWAKRQRVQDALTRLGGADIRVEEILGAKNPLHYRNKSQYPVGADGAIGFYRARSHQVVPVKRCLIQPEAADKTAAAVGEWMRRYKVPAYDEATGKGLVRHVYVRVNRKGESLCCVVINGRQAPREPELAAYVCAAVPHTAGVLVNSNTKRGNVILGEKYRTLWGRDYLMDTLCGLEFKLSVPSFYQVNREGAELLYKEVQKRADLREGQKVVDLFCGIGTIGLCLCKDVPGAELVGVEVVPEAVENAKKNALRNGIPNARFFLGDANHPAVNEADLVVVDPPRKGLEEELIESLSARAFRKIIYVSCDPATLARDLKRFQMRSWLLGDVQPVDMFPRTGHVETVVLLSRETINDYTIGNLNLSNNQQTVMETDAKRRIAGKFTDNRPMTDGLKTDEEYVICGVNHQPHNCNILVEWENDKYPAVNLMIPAEDGVLYRVNKE